MEKTSEYWTNNAQASLNDILTRKQHLGHAKNVIMFLGDGMSFPTIAAARMYSGAEENSLSFEKFPYSGFSKTYCVDSQVADSACTATAYLSGVKNNYKTIGVNANVKVNQCEADVKDHTESIARWAQMAGKGTGIVTTTRITHASPAGVYAHIGHRDWENDYEMEISKCNSTIFDDIAEQLIYNTEGQNLKVILGGGRAGFRSTSNVDEEGNHGFRLDGRDLIEEWKNERNKLGKATYVWNKEGLTNIDYANTDYLMGLFEHNHMKYNLDVVNQKLENQEPSLTDMTIAAIKMLENEENGYFLFIEGGMIDQAHHDNLAQKSLDETLEFSKAIDAARRMTNESETLIVVTADHSHVFTYNGYPERGNDILGWAEISDEDFLPFTTLSYANGPGVKNNYGADGKRIDPRTFDRNDPEFQFPATVEKERETHGGDDVGVWASGPMSHLFRGSYDQTAIPLLMAHILQVGPYDISSSYSKRPIFMFMLAMFFILKLFK